MVLSKFDLDVGRGAYRQGSVEVVHKFGSSSLVTTTPSDLWDLSTIQPQIGRPPEALPVRIRSGGDVNDTAAGTGARSILILGINDSGEVAAETIVTAGASQSAQTTGNYWRVFRTDVMDTGVYSGTNTGTIIIENTNGLGLSGILAANGQTGTTLFSIGGANQASLVSVDAFIEGTKSVNITMYQHTAFNKVVSPFGAVRVIGQWQQLPEGTHDLVGRTSIPVAPWSDTWFVATTNTSTSAVSIVGTYITSAYPTQRIFEKK